MKILFLSSHGDAFPLGTQMAKEGHAIKFHSKEKNAGSGFVPLVDSYEEHVEWADLVISDGISWGGINEELRRKGKDVIGGTRVTDRLEEDRQSGQDMFNALGMNTLESHPFVSMDQAIAYIGENPKKFVVKVSGKAQTDKALTYVGQMEDGEDVIRALHHYKDKMPDGVSSVQLQEVAEGVEVAIGGWFNGKDFLDPVLVNFEHKRLMGSRYSQAGLGPATGEMGTIGCWKDKGFDLYRETLGLFVPILRSKDYHGYFDINCIVHSVFEQGFEFHVHPLEMTNRFGWPTLLMQIEAMKIQGLGDLFKGIASGAVSDFKVDGHYCACVVVGVPPLPYADKKIADRMSNGLPIIFRDGSSEGVYPGDAILKDGEWVCQGEKGYACVATGCGDSVQDAQMKAYQRTRNIIIPNAMYREDIGDTVTGSIMQIQRLLEHPKVEA